MQPLAESKERYRETLEIVRLALTTENFSYDGQFFQPAQTTLRLGKLIQTLACGLHSYKVQRSNPLTDLNRMLHISRFLLE